MQRKTLYRINLRTRHDHNGYDEIVDKEPTLEMLHEIRKFLFSELVDAANQDVLTARSKSDMQLGELISEIKPHHLIRTLTENVYVDIQVAGTIIGTLNISQLFVLTDSPPLHNLLIQPPPVYVPEGDPDAFGGSDF